MRQDQNKEVDMMQCRCFGCPHPPSIMGIWTEGDEKGLWVAYCESHGYTNYMTDVQPWRWPLRSLEEIEQEFWKEFDS